MNKGRIFYPQFQIRESLKLNSSNLKEPETGNEGDNSSKIKLQDDEQPFHKVKTVTFEACKASPDHIKKVADEEISHHNIQYV